MEGTPKMPAPKLETAESASRLLRERLLQVLQSEKAVSGSGLAPLSPEQRADAAALLSSVGTSFDDPVLAGLNAMQIMDIVDYTQSIHNPAKRKELADSFRAALEGANTTFRSALD